MDSPLTTNLMVRCEALHSYTLRRSIAAIPLPLRGNFTPLDSRMARTFLNVQSRGHASVKPQFSKPSTSPSESATRGGPSRMGESSNELAALAMLGSKRPRAPVRAPATVVEDRLNHVVVQAPYLPEHVLDEFIRLMRPGGSTVRLPLATGDAYRLHDVGRVAPERAMQLQALADRHGVDTAVVPGWRSIDRVGLVASDMDSTLILGECIDAIARKWQSILDARGVTGRDIGKQIEAITTRAMNGEIDFAESLRERVALLEGFPVSELREVYREHVELSPGAREMIAAFKGVGAEVGVLSGGFTQFTAPLKADLGLDFQAANVLETDGEVLTGRVIGEVFDALAKADQVRARRPAGAMAAAVGDGSNDVPMLGEADVGIAYHAKNGVAEAARKRGGVIHEVKHTGLDALPNLFLSRVGS